MTLDLRKITRNEIFNIYLNTPEKRAAVTFKIGGVQDPSGSVLAHATDERLIKGVIAMLRDDERS